MESQQQVRRVTPQTSLAEGNSQAIATFAREVLADDTMTVKAALKGDCLYLLLENDPVPVATEMTVFAEELVKQLLAAGLEAGQLQQVKVGGQRRGDRVPVWCHQFFVPAPVSDGEAIAEGEASVDVMGAGGNAGELPVGEDVGAAEVEVEEEGTVEGNVTDNDTADAVEAAANAVLGLDENSDESLTVGEALDEGEEDEDLQEEEGIEEDANAVIDDGAVIEDGAISHDVDLDADGGEAGGDEGIEADGGDPAGTLQQALQSIAGLAIQVEKIGQAVATLTALQGAAVQGEAEDALDGEPDGEEEEELDDGLDDAAEEDAAGDDGAKELDLAAIDGEGAERAVDDALDLEVVADSETVIDAIAEDEGRLETVAALDESEPLEEIEEKVLDGEEEQVDNTEDPVAEPSTRDQAMAAITQLTQLATSGREDVDVNATLAVIAQLSAWTQPESVMVVEDAVVEDAVAEEGLLEDEIAEETIPEQGLAIAEEADEHEGAEAEIVELETEEPEAHPPEVQAPEAQEDLEKEAPEAIVSDDDTASEDGIAEATEAGETEDEDIEQEEVETAPDASLTEAAADDEGTSGEDEPEITSETAAIATAVARLAADLEAMAQNQNALAAMVADTQAMLAAGVPPAGAAVDEGDGSAGDGPDEGESEGLNEGLEDDGESLEELVDLSEVGEGDDEPESDGDGITELGEVPEADGEESVAAGVDIEEESEASESEVSEGPQGEKDLGGQEGQGDLETTGDPESPVEPQLESGTEPGVELAAAPAPEIDSALDAQEAAAIAAVDTTAIATEVAQIAADLFRQSIAQEQAVLSKMVAEAKVVMAPITTAVSEAMTDDSSSQLSHSAPMSAGIEGADIEIEVPIEDDLGEEEVENDGIDIGPPQVEGVEIRSEDGAVIPAEDLFVKKSPEPEPVELPEAQESVAEAEADEIGDVSPEGHDDKDLLEPVEVGIDADPAGEDSLDLDDLNLSDLVEEIALEDGGDADEAEDDLELDADALAAIADLANIAIASEVTDLAEDFEDGLPLNIPEAPPPPDLPAPELPELDLSSPTGPIPEDSVPPLGNDDLSPPGLDTREQSPEESPKGLSQKTSPPDSPDIAPPGLEGDTGLEGWLAQGSDAAESQDLSPPKAPQGQRFLRFHLGFEDTALLPVDQVREILRVPVSEILPVPHVPESVLGIYNWRGEMLWMVDLNHLVGFSPLGPTLANQETPLAMAIVLEVERQNLGLIVPQIEDIEWHESPTLQAPSAGLFPDRLLPFVSGYLTEASSMVLNATAIASAESLQVPL